jgi:arsenate reductase
MKQTKSILFPEIEKIIQSLQFETITGERKFLPLVDFIQNKVYNQEDIKLNNLHS